MNQSLQAKCDLLAENYQVCADSAKLDFQQAAVLGAIIFTNENRNADEATIRQNRALLKSKTGVFSNLRGYTNLALLCKMSFRDDPEAYLDSVLSVYDQLKGRVMRSEYQALTASCIVDMAEPDQYGAVVDRTKEVYEKMREFHPFLTGHEDLTIASLLVMSGLDVKETVEEAERCYQYLKDDHFTFAKDALQSVSMVLALSTKPVQEKCDRFHALREALKEAKSQVFAEQLAIVAALVDCNAPIEQLVEEVHEADMHLKTKKGFHGIFGVGAQMRRTTATAMVLQAHNDEKARENGTSNAVSTMITENIIMNIVTTIVMITVIIAVQSSSSSS